jgi:hypothetical protein
MNELQRLLQGKLLQEQEGMSEERGIISPKMDSIDPSNYEEQSTTNTQLDAMIPSRPEEAPISIDHSEPVQPEVEEVAPQRELSPTEILREQLEKVRSQSKSEEEEARKNAMWSNVLQTLGTIGQAQIQRGAKTQVGITPGKMVSAQEAIAPVRSERNAQLKALMDEYKMLQGQAPKALTDLDKAKIESEKARAAKFLADAKKAERAESKESKSEFQKVKERELAKANVEYFRKDRDQLISNSDKIDNALKILKDKDIGPTISGPWRGLAPDKLRSITNPQAIIVKESIQSAIQETLRPTLGAQFTEKEGERIMNLAYNDTLPPSANIKRAEELQKLLNRKMKFSEDLYKHLEENNGSDKGFDYSKYGMGKSKLEKSEFSSSQEKGIEKVMKANNISREQAINALKKAGKL